MNSSNPRGLPLLLLVLGILGALAGCPPLDESNKKTPPSEAHFDSGAHQRQHGKDAKSESDPASAPAAADAKREHGHDLPKTATHWYCTMHGKPAGNSVHGIDENGTVLGAILEAVPESAGGNAKGVRGMLHLGEHGLLVVSANLADTRLIRYGPPASDGTLPFVSLFAQKALKNPDLVHSYALAVGADGTVYASNQDTNTVSAYAGIGTAQPGAPLDVPKEIAGLGIPAGTIVPSRVVSPQGITEIRGIAIGADGLLYVCDRGAAQVVVFDPRTGLRLRVLADESHGLVHPIQLLFAPDGHTVYLTDNGMPGIFRIDTATGAIILFANRSTGCPELPSSLAMDKDHLYVGDRKKQEILRFKLATGEPDHTPFAQLPDAPEFMIPASLLPAIPQSPKAKADD